MKNVIDIMTRGKLTELTFTREQAIALIRNIEQYADRPMPYSEQFMINQTIRFIENAAGLNVVVESKENENEAI